MWTGFEQPFGKSTWKGTEASWWQPVRNGGLLQQPRHEPSWKILPLQSVFTWPPPWSLFCLPPHERLKVTTWQLSLSHIPGPQKFWVMGVGCFKSLILGDICCSAKITNIHFKQCLLCHGYYIIINYIIIVGQVESGWEFGDNIINYWKFLIIFPKYSRTEDTSLLYLVKIALLNLDIVGASLICWHYLFDFLNFFID